MMIDPKRYIVAVEKKWIEKHFKQLSEQSSKPKYFERRNPEDSKLPINLTLHEMFDYIRMLDFDSYPKAFINHGNLKLDFTNAAIDASRITA